MPMASPSIVGRPMMLGGSGTSSVLIAQTRRPMTNSLNLGCCSGRPRQVGFLQALRIRLLLLQAVLLQVLILQAPILQVLPLRLVLHLLLRLLRLVICLLRQALILRMADAGGGSAAAGWRRQRQLTPSPGSPTSSLFAPRIPCSLARPPRALGPGLRHTLGRLPLGWHPRRR